MHEFTSVLINKSVSVNSLHLRMRSCILSKIYHITRFYILTVFLFCDNLLSGQFAENETNEVNFREIPSHVLSKVCMYFTYKVRYTNSSTEIPEFPIAPEIALELLMAANFLDC